MKTLQDYKALFQMDRDTARTHFRGLRQWAGELDRIQAEDRAAGRAPADTVARFTDRAGLEIAQLIVASLVNRSAWDGRISRQVATWAAGIPSAWDEQAATQAGIQTSMHPAHLDQVARAMMEAGRVG